MVSSLRSGSGATAFYGDGGPASDRRLPMLPVRMACALSILPTLALAGEVERGFKALDKKDYDTAIACFTEAIRLEPQDPFVHRFRGCAYLEKQEYDKAIADFSESIRLAPSESSGYYKRGVAYAGKKDFDRALRDCGVAIGL